ncbi:sigma-54 interaction domain-containing protein [Desulfosporosinus youngiae]|uniref:Transcriptional regulator containing PAS, AAA-type ATPase, and DNA-binding domains n=1 Tax=Desulfosporosinus youngiae DSM 17734 TaxID=768710 RepID=H5XUH0_9FIRM|nr:sigma 54-interacting transcriptional regulator [Desulfosporosinus youngiae]EHQ89406.1 transcriptional regulator containing PAS, AAA-type ATPase, and DNA-binding domains [Desulfosporosinus youngiae DSM 17734]
MEHEGSFYAEILDNINIGIFVLDAEGNYLYFNDAYCKMNYKPPSFYKNTSVPKMKELGIITSGAWEKVMREKRQATVQLTVTDEDNDNSYQVFVSGTPSFTGDGSINHVICLAESVEKLNIRIQTGILNKCFGTNSTMPKLPKSIDIIAESPGMKLLLSQLSIVAKTDAAVLIIGPTGSGKEVVAEYIHRMSARGNGPFIVVNCAAIPENLLESELFGYEKGSFTGASSLGKRGLIEMADGGTLFLDEINSIPLSLQAKLLRVLETRQVKRVGSLASKAIDFRLLTASNEELEALIREKRFRSDLFYRISVVPVRILPLLERKEDIIPLALYFLQHFCKKYSCMKVLSEQVMDFMLSYDWPGNVRELRNFIERLIATSPESDLLVEGIPAGLLQTATQREQNPVRPLLSPVAENTTSSIDESQFSYQSYMNQCEEQLLRNAFAHFKTPAKVAEILKLDLSNVYRKKKKYNI